MIFVLTAENSWNSRFNSLAIIRARVVLPQPGGPQKMRDGKKPASPLGWLLVTELLSNFLIMPPRPSEVPLCAWRQSCLPSENLGDSHGLGEEVGTRGANPARDPNHLAAPVGWLRHAPVGHANLPRLLRQARRMAQSGACPGYEGDGPRVSDDDRPSRPGRTPIGGMRRADSIGDDPTEQAHCSHRANHPHR